MASPGESPREGGGPANHGGYRSHLPIYPSGNVRPREKAGLGGEEAEEREVGQTRAVLGASPSDQEAKAEGSTSQGLDDSVGTLS